MDDNQFDTQDVQDFWYGYDSPAASSSPIYRLSNSVPSVTIIPPAESTRDLAVIPPHEPKTLPIYNEEDSYWASYGAIQGTADSTVPSPRMPTKTGQTLDEFGRLILCGDYETESIEQADIVEEADHVYDISDAHDSYHNGGGFILGAEAFAPAHQRALALALAQVSPRPPGAFDLEDELEDSNTPESSSPSTTASSYAEADLKMAIRGLYNLWKTGSKLEEDACREAFQTVVKDALDN